MKHRSLGITKCCATINQTNKQTNQTLLVNLNGHVGNIFLSVSLSLSPSLSFALTTHSHNTVAHPIKHNPTHTTSKRPMKHSIHLPFVAARCRDFNIVPVNSLASAILSYTPGDLLRRTNPCQAHFHSQSREHIPSINFKACSPLQMLRAV